MLSPAFGTGSDRASPRHVAVLGMPAPSTGTAVGVTGYWWNELYIGRLIYNRQRFVTDPETGRRVPKANLPADWVVVEVPELRIVEQTIWDQAQALKARAAGEKPQNCRRPRRLLSGLLRCGACGGAYTVIGEERVG